MARLVRLLMVPLLGVRGLGEDAACLELSFSELDAEKSIERGIPVWSRLSTKTSCATTTVADALGGTPRLLHRTTRLRPRCVVDNQPRSA